MDEGTRKLYEERGMGNRQGAGSRPALIVVDLNNGFTDPESPLHCDTEEAVGANVKLLAAARESGCPVVFTSLVYDEAGQKVAKAFIEKVPSLLTLAPGTRWPEVDQRLDPQPDEPILHEAVRLRLLRHPAHRAPVRGAGGHGGGHRRVHIGLRAGDRRGRPPVRLPRGGAARGGRRPRARTDDNALFDIDQKYGDVVSTDEAVEMFRNAQFD